MSLMSSGAENAKMWNIIEKWSWTNSSERISEKSVRQECNFIDNNTRNNNNNNNT